LELTIQGADPIKIKRDDNGIPHVKASNLNDLVKGTQMEGQVLLDLGSGSGLTDLAVDGLDDLQPGILDRD